jgi:hypothetical protein
MVVSSQTFHLEALFLRIKDCQVLLNILWPRLLESTRSCEVISSCLIFWLRSSHYLFLPIGWIMTRSWYTKFQWLTIENLIKIESRRSLIKANIFSRKYFIIRCSSFLCPISSRIIKIILHFVHCSHEIICTFKNLSITLKVFGSLILWMW